jgi:phospholipid/cholesterol/gamma-HCH transport system substrate-binding protein
MKESSQRHTVIVGLFVLIGLAILIAGVLMVGNLNKKFENKIRLVALFDDVSGLQKGNYIWFSGVRIGTVKSLGFYGATQVEVSMDIDKKVQHHIPKDARVKLGSDAFIGNRILIIYGGTIQGDKVNNGDTLRVEKTLSSEEMINTLQANNENLKVITSDFKIISNKLVAGEGTLGKLLNDDEVYRNFNHVLSSLKDASEKAQQIAGSLSTFSSGLNRKGTLANELTTDTIVFKSVKTSLLRLQQIEDTAALFLTNLKQAGNNPDTPIGVLLHDKKSGSDLKETIRNLDSSSQKLDEDLKAMQSSFLLKKYFKQKANDNKRDSLKK